LTSGPIGYIRSSGRLQPETTNNRKMIAAIEAFGIRRRHPTVELTRRREFNQASPDESSCETRSRRSRPTICWVAPASKRTISNF
jgi:hypothetical protein